MTVVAGCTTGAPGVTGQRVVHTPGVAGLGTGPVSTPAPPADAPLEPAVPASVGPSAPSGALPGPVAPASTAPLGQRSTTD